MTDSARRAALAGAVAVAAVVSFLPAAGFGYVQDDRSIQGNPIVERGDPLEILRSDYWRGGPEGDSSLYRPVTIGSFALERRLLGRFDAPVSHRVNLALHALASVLLFAWGVRLGAGDAAATAAGLLFAVHPLHTSAVANLVGRAEILSAVFSLAALGTALHRRSRAAAWGSAALLLLALGSKETSIATPVILAAQVLLTVRGTSPSRRDVWLARAGALAPSVLAVLLYAILRTAALGEFPAAQPVRPMENVLVGAAPMARFATALAMAGRYARLLLAPHPLSADYSGSAIALEPGLLGALPVAGILVLAALAAIAALPLLPRFRRAPRAVPASLGALAFLLPYLVVGNLVVLTGAGFAERLIYGASAGACLLAGLAYDAAAGVAPARRRAAAVVLAALVVGGAAVSRSEAALWRDEETVFTAAARRVPGSVRAHLTVSRALSARGRIDEALREADAAIAAMPEHAPSRVEKALLLGGRGDLDGAESELRDAARLDPRSAEIHARLGMLLQMRGRPDAAAKALRRAAVLEPRLWEARLELARLLLNQGKDAEAAALLRRLRDEGVGEAEALLAAAERRSPGR